MYNYVTKVKIMRLNDNSMRRNHKFEKKQLMNKLLNWINKIHCGTVDLAYLDFVPLFQILHNTKYIMCNNNIFVQTDCKWLNNNNINISLIIGSIFYSLFWK